MNDLLQNKWLLLGGVAVAALGAYWYLSAPASASDTSGGLLAAPAASPFDPTGGAMTAYSPSIAATSSGSPSSDPNAYISALANLQSQNDAMNGQIALAQISAGQTIALAQNQSNYDLGVKSVAAQNAMTAAGLFASVFGKIGTGYVTSAYGNLAIDPLTGSVSFASGDLYSGGPHDTPQNSTTMAAAFDSFGMPFYTSKSAMSQPVNTVKSTGGFNVPASSSSGGASHGGSASVSAL